MLSRLGSSGFDDCKVSNFQGTDPFIVGVVRNYARFVALETTFDYLEQWDRGISAWKPCLKYKYCKSANAFQSKRCVHWKLVCKDY